MIDREIGSRHVGPAAVASPNAGPLPPHRGRKEDYRVRATATTGGRGERARDLAVRKF